MKPLTNEFKAPEMKAVPGTKFKPTDPKIISETIGRDASPYHNLKQPIFEDATIKIETTGLFGYFAVKRCDDNAFLKSVKQSK